MANTPDHKFVAELRERRNISEDVAREDVFEGEALISCLATPDQRINSLMRIDQEIAGTDNLREKAQLLSLKRYYETAHRRLRAAGR
jgi:hypothetical protein